MSIQPTGRPLWSRTVTKENYGGHDDLKNYQSQGVTNPRTDLGAEGYARLTADAEAAGRTAEFFEATFTCGDTEHRTSDGIVTGPGAPFIESALMMTGVSLAGYEGGNPAIGFPGATRSGTGHVVFTFAESYADAYGVEEPFTPRYVLCELHGSTMGVAVPEIVGQAVHVRCFGHDGAAIGDARVTVTVS